MEEDKRFKKLEQNTEFVMNYIQDQQEKEAQAALEQDKQSAVDKALKEEREKHKEELKTLKESYEKGAKEAVQEVLKEVLGDKKTVKQNSRHPEQQKSQENFIAQGLIKPAGVNLKGIPGYENITLEENTDKTITQQVSEQLPMNQRLKSVLYRPAVVRGKVLENAGQTAEEFLDTIAKNQ
jgi:viroplasmin and RNaseH domain-containing protein